LTCCWWTKTGNAVGVLSAGVVVWRGARWSRCSGGEWYMVGGTWWSGRD
jgi:hypothetical protein